MAPHRHGIGREVDDDELFGDPERASLRAHKRPRRPQPSASSTQPNRATAKATAAAAAATANANADACKQAASLEQLRAAFAPPPRSHRACVAPFISPPCLTKDEHADEAARFQLAPHLSSLALRAARRVACSGQLRDLSRLADEHVFAIFSAASMSDAVLVELERCNPSRVDVLEALWSRLVVQEYNVTSLPDGITWWRAFYQAKKEEDESCLQRARERLRSRYIEGEAGRQSTKLASARTVSKNLPARRRRGAASSSAVAPTIISRLRNQVRKGRQRR